MAVDTKQNCAQEPVDADNLHLKTAALRAYESYRQRVPDNEQMAERHDKGISLFAAMGAYAPTMGILGAIMGLISALSHMDDPSSLGGAIAVAFIASLYGVALANLVFLPMSSRLQKDHETEMLNRTIMLEGVIAVQAGDNPYIVQRKLERITVPCFFQPHL